MGPGIARLAVDLPIGLGNGGGIEGGIGAFPRRVAVATEDEERARAVLREAGEATA